MFPPLDPDYVIYKDAEHRVFLYSEREYAKKSRNQWTNPLFWVQCASRADQNALARFLAQVRDSLQRGPMKISQRQL